MSAKKSDSFTDITSKVKATKPAFPQIYWYSTPEIRRHDGCLKIGYTEQNVEERVYQQTHTADVVAKIEGHGNAIFEGDGKVFRDTDFRSYLFRNGYTKCEQEKNNEWVRIDSDDCRRNLMDYRFNRGIIAGDDDSVTYYDLRAEQDAAVKMAVDYAHEHENGEFLWNAKPRFGKTLASYDLCMRLGAKRILIITNRPAIANSWYDDYEKFVGTKNGYWFVSDSSALDRNRCRHLLTHEEYVEVVKSGRKPDGLIEFVGLQDLKGGISFGGKFDKLGHIEDTQWDVMILDEAHEAVDTDKTQIAFDRIHRKFTLHLSGTPFKAIADEKFTSDAIFNWSYADEQSAKDGWDYADGDNPYEDLPRLNMFTYQMSDVIADEIKKGADIDGEMHDYAFDLNEFFATDEKGRFVHDKDVDKFLDALVSQKRFPFSTPELRHEMTHTLWLLHYVSSATAMRDKLQKHPIFKDYDIVLAAGDWDDDDGGKIKTAYDGVKNAIANYAKRGKTGTITLSVGQLTTGVTVPEWTGVMMLSNMKSPALYMQAAFRAQNPCLFTYVDGTQHRKTDAYVFDFDMTRTLEIVETFANGLYSETANGNGDADERKNNVRRLLNFFPVYGEDTDGEMVELDAEHVLSIPTGRRAYDVVRHGFMDNNLFQNISGVFASMEMVDIIKQIAPCKEIPYAPVGVDDGTAERLSLDDDGEVDVPDDIVIGKATEMFGDKVYGSIREQLTEVLSDLRSKSMPSKVDVALNQVRKRFEEELTKPLVTAAAEEYGDHMSAAQRKRIESGIKSDVDHRLTRTFGNFDIDRKKIEHEHSVACDDAETPEEIAELDAERDRKLAEAQSQLADEVEQMRDELVNSTGESIVRELETANRNAEKRTLEMTIRDHLRGFARSIPSFLMAYGDDDTSLENFETYLPSDEFKEMTGITLEQFKLLRDGGDVQTDDGVVHVDGHLFDPVVFNASIKEFMRLRRKLANYLDPSHDEDIFDYIPPQRTNQIFTPRSVIIQMLDSFEKENPGCFDCPDTTFIDPYMKSGMYITEIVKRLYSSDKMRELFPDDKERLYHIFEYQVFGIAPTNILYNITTNYILGVDEELSQLDGSETNFDKMDMSLLSVNEEEFGAYIDERFGNVPEYHVDAA